LGVTPPIAAEQMSEKSDSIETSADLDDVIADYMRRVDRGEQVNKPAIIAAHPHLEAKLKEYFSQADAIENIARDHATIAHTPSRKDSHGLHIRCPHCSNFVEVLTDTPYEEISCSTCGSRFSLVEREATRLAAPLKSIDRFDLVTRLGVGGFGTVWKARDRELDRTVAVKIPRRGQLSPSEIDQFFREARAAAQLRHPNIVPVHEVGREGETLFIVSDFVRGVTLSDWLTGNVLSPREVAQLCVPIADALHHAHEQGVVHRDLKPSNIMIDEQGQPHLTDFGLAKREVGEITMTVDGQVLGTPGYMSPEQAGGQSHWTDRRTDIYSFGVVLFQLLTGELPFRGNAQMQIHKRLTEDAPDPRSLNRHIPRDLSTICLKCLEREPGRRYSTAAELADEFGRFLRGEPIHARPLSPPERWLRWAQRKPMVATTAALVCFLAIAGPITAMTLASQRAQLNVRLAERDKLIESNAGQMREANETIDGMRTELDVWEGRANPADFWPHRVQTPRHNVIAELFDRASGSLASALPDGKFDPTSAASGYLALAMMAEELGKRDLATKYYQSARDSLITLRENNPEDSAVAQALADCYSALGRLETEENRGQATTDFARAREIYEQLADRPATDAKSQVAWLESELKSATLAGFDAGEANLARVEQIHRALSEKWPDDPVTLYRLTCFLIEREPVLTTVSSDQTKEKKE
jgi:serine/threonine protein kinase